MSVQGVKRAPTVQDLEGLLKESLRLKESFTKKHGETLLGIGLETSKRLKRGSKLIVAGNGGSATDAQQKSSSPEKGCTGSLAGGTMSMCAKSAAT